MLGDVFDRAVYGAAVYGPVVVGVLSTTEREAVLTASDTSPLLTTATSD